MIVMMTANTPSLNASNRPECMMPPGARAALRLETYYRAFLHFKSRPPGHAGARPNSCPASLPVSHSSSKAIIMAAQANSIAPTNKRNHPIATLDNLARTLIAAIKSP
jgi:hypothetical protein